MKTANRRKEIAEGAEKMLLANGWVNEYKGKNPPADLKNWSHPNRKHKYTLAGATAIEELKESL